MKEQEVKEKEKRGERTKEKLEHEGRGGGSMEERGKEKEGAC